jgi:hypothetical protein
VDCFERGGRRWVLVSVKMMVEDGGANSTFLPSVYMIFCTLLRRIIKGIFVWNYNLFR